MLGVFFLSIVTMPFSAMVCLYLLKEKCLIVSSENTHYYLSSE